MLISVNEKLVFHNDTVIISYCEIKMINERAYHENFEHRKRIPKVSSIIEVQPLSIINASPQLMPSELEYLTFIDHLFVEQEIEWLEVLTGFETNNKFTIKNNLGQNIFWAAEISNVVARNCFCHLRPFDLKVFDLQQNEVLSLERPLACDQCCFPCCLQKMFVRTPAGHFIGSIEQLWSICFPRFVIKNALGDIVLRIEGPFCKYSICGNNVEFKILTFTGVEIGKISKKWSGLAREIFTDSDFFGINFPIDLDTQMKAVMLGACFLIDAMFFEESCQICKIGTGVCRVCSFL